MIFLFGRGVPNKTKGMINLKVAGHPRHVGIKCGAMTFYIVQGFVVGQGLG